MPEVHPTAILEGDVNLADDVKIGPYCIIKGPVTLGQGVQLLEHVSISGPTTIGAETILYPRAAIGYEPQDYKFKPGAPTAGVVVGERCIIREHATINAASNDHTPTRIGNDVFVMVNSHVGHDAIVGNNVVMVNNTCLAGHTTIQDKVTFSACCLIHQNCRIGELCMLSGGTAVTTEVPPFMMVYERNEIIGLNLVGLRRNGYSSDDINNLRDVFTKILRENMPRDELLDALSERMESSETIRKLHAFVSEAKRPIAPVSRKRNVR
ncbi:MAG: acyl-ACP--UDP-N-acetylglucosamine O-acyltransferase [Phycisphaera sp.]|nr:MAG: acyl-ACP--UDP-N-acetylglucosamine O-acyltransferase [Phycisphaera sp.]